MCSWSYTTNLVYCGTVVKDESKRQRSLDIARILTHTRFNHTRIWRRFPHRKGLLLDPRLGIDYTQTPVFFFFQRELLSCREEKLKCLPSDRGLDKSLEKDILSLLNCLQAVQCVPDFKLLQAVTNAGMSFGYSVVFESLMLSNSPLPYYCK